MARIQFGREICGNLSEALQREWIETNGLGGFASSTIAGMNTRRYHGLLTAAIKPPAARAVLLSKFEETVVANGRRYELSVNRYPGTVHPQGHQYLRDFRLDPFPVFTYVIEDGELEQRVFLVHGENTVAIEYEWRGAGACLLELRPLVAFRDFHSLSHQNDSINGSVTLKPGLATIAPYQGMPELYFGHNAGEVHATGDWYFRFEYDAERDRGLDFQEDLFNPFAATFPLSELRAAVVIASTKPHRADEVPAFREAEVARRAAVVAGSPSRDPLVQALTAAADQFLAVRGEYKTIIAGYHWFADWGRDTMIALPGLALVTGRHEVARSILLAFSGSLSEGMLPNWFPGSGEIPEYNTVDATLWFFEAVRSYMKYSGDVDFVRDKLYDKLKDIADWHLRGTRYGIRADSDGLLAAGIPCVQLTWMDSKIGDWVVTPRTGKPVEIQALWYNALCILSDLAMEFGDEPAHVFFGGLAERAKSSFNAKFWNSQEDCLYDVVNGDERDAAIRPNQIFAVSLRHSMLAPDQARRVVDVVQRELLTPVGLRSLSPRDSRYRPRYEGGVESRDSAYHQGTVWPWLLGPFLTAYVSVRGRTPEAKREAQQMLQPIREHLRVAGLGHISEIADAEAPHAPRGCVAQAWSVAEILRAAMEDLSEIECSPDSSERESQAAVTAA
jgi:predicted glycogen debranching enzyme